MSRGVESVTVVTDTYSMNTTQKSTTTVLDNIVSFMERFIAFADDDHKTVLAAYVLHTHCFDSAVATPYIYVTSAEKQSGKSTTLEVMQALVHNPMKAGSITGAAMYQAIETSRPTVMFDEVDTIFSGAANEGLRGMLNEGYKRGGNIMRYAPGKDEPQSYSVFGPKLLAGIDNGAMPDTIRDRCITIRLKRAKRDGSQPIERFIQSRIQADIDALKDEINVWVQANQDKVAAHIPADIPEISARAFEISEPLLQVASRVRGWSPKVKAAVIRLLGDQEVALSIGAQALTSAREYFTENADAKVIMSAELADRLSISPKKLGVVLKPYGITPGTKRVGSDTAKGYDKGAFVDAWERYL